MAAVSAGSGSVLVWKSTLLVDSGFFSGSASGLVSSCLTSSLTSFCSSAFSSAFSSDFSSVFSSDFSSGLASVLSSTCSSFLSSADCCSGVWSSVLACSVSVLSAAVVSIRGVKEEHSANRDRNSQLQ